MFPRARLVATAGGSLWLAGAFLGACVELTFVGGKYLCDPADSEPCPQGLVCAVDGVCRSPGSEGPGGAGAAVAAGGAGGVHGAGGASDAGGGGMAPSCSAPAEMCGACTHAQCPLLHCACDGNPACDEFAACATLCPGATNSPTDEELCVQDCRELHPTGFADFELLWNCQLLCPADCSGPRALTSCQSCRYIACRPESEACFGSEPCWARLVCVGLCTANNRGAAVQDCIEQNCPAHADADALYACSLARCGNETC